MTLKPETICTTRGILWVKHRWGPQYDCWILNTLAMNQTGTIWEGLEYFGCFGHVFAGVLDFLPHHYWSLSFSTTPLKELFKDPCLRSRRQTSVSERALICSTNQVRLLFRGSFFIVSLKNGRQDQALLKKIKGKLLGTLMFALIFLKYL